MLYDLGAARSRPLVAFVKLKHIIVSVMLLNLLVCPNYLNLVRSGGVQLRLYKLQQLKEKQWY